METCDARPRMPGVPPLLVVRADGRVEDIVCRGPLYCSGPCDSSRGVGQPEPRRCDAIVLYTDGVSEARTGSGPVVGKAFRAVRASCAGGSVHTIASRLAGGAIAHSEGRAGDDVAVVVGVAQA
jgi:sigma-B regulation protein RsbU (phosphoserine phosphatase)